MPRSTQRRPVASMTTRLSIGGAAIVLYAAALGTNALEFTYETGGQMSLRGLEAALLGWQALLIGNVGWVANLLLFAGLLLLILGLTRTSTVVAASGVVAGLHTLMLFGARLPVDEGGTRHMALTQLRAGFYLWLGSVSLVMLGAGWTWLSQGPTRPSERRHST